MRTRVFPESNYRSVFFNNKTLRFRIDQSKSIDELRWPEFYDVKITNKCNGKCPECYQASIPKGEHAKDLISNFNSFFGPMDENQRPYQIAIGGGEPTLHPQFFDLLIASDSLGIVPNYTTNGMWSYGVKEDTVFIPQCRNVLDATQRYCGGVAVSVHPQLEKYWRKAAWLFIKNGIRTNLHIIISDRESIDIFSAEFKHQIRLAEGYKYAGVDYFVLLPYEAMGRAKPKEIEFEYLFNKIRELKSEGWDISKISYGANFYEELKKQSWLDVSLYEPHAFSAYLDMLDMKLYKSSFELVPKWTTKNY